jgi:hypothetical protein
VRGLERRRATRCWLFSSFLYTFRNMAIYNSPLLAGDEIVVLVFFVLVPFLAGVQRTLGIPVSLLGQGGQSIPATSVFFLEQAMDGLVFFRYFHAKRITM